MINMSFWNTVKNKWIRNNDPTVAQTDGLIQKTTKTQEEIEELNRKLNGLNSVSDSISSIDDISNAMDLLNELGVEEIDFDALFSE